MHRSPKRLVAIEHDITFDGDRRRYASFRHESLHDYLEALAEVHAAMGI
jgi:hypothetical protein